MPARKGFKAGDKVVFARCKANKEHAGLTIGKVYVVIMDGSCPTLFDDDNDLRYAPLDADSGMKPTKIVEA